MTVFALPFLGVLFLTEPSEVPPERIPAAVSSVPASKSSPKTVVSSAVVTSRSCDLDGAEGVVLFEGNVFVRYTEEFSMSADRVYMFLAGSNDVSRVVAVGSVVISNETRVGSCDMATYRRRKGEIEMLGDGPQRVARLDDRDTSTRSVVGSRILFWLDSEQVKVEDSRIFSERKKGDGLP